jgi:ABC-type phosphate transport system substrate-binding protein
MSNVKSLKLLDGPNELSANDYSILTGAYPLVRKITLVVNANSEVGMQLAKEFVKFAICQDGQRETIIAGFFPLDPPLIRAQKSKLEPEHLEQEQGKKE